MNPASSPDLSNPRDAQLVPGGGSAEPRGASLVAGGVNFSVYSERADTIWVCLFDPSGRETGRYALDGRDEHVHFGLISGIGEGVRYGLRAEGPYDPGHGLLFDPAKLLVDPYARHIDQGFVRTPRLALPRGDAGDTAKLVPKAIVVGDGAAAQPRRDAPNLIYELNVRGFSKLRPDVPADLRGTVAALTAPAILDHFTRLGVDVVELMPVAAWIDEGHLPPLGLANAWGYNPMTYFAPDPRLMPGGIADLRQVADAYRAAGISVILDVVYNHTGESDAKGPILSMKGLDAPTYYRHVEADGQLALVNDTGTGNTLNCDHPEVRRLIVDSLKYWVEQGGVSGFRFDLAPVLGRSLAGFNADAETLQAIRTDPVLSQCLLIAEPWDPGPGGYHLGAFGPPFFEWNDKYRDDVRSFWQGGAIPGVLAGRVSGSADVFDRKEQSPRSSVNFLAAHDGFTLRDLVSYAHKHNEANGEQNRDGHDHNHSWNCGVEGEADDPDLAARRKRDAKALLATLFVSRGTPMLQQGDELWRTQQGNNNAYAQDNVLTWVDWGGADADLATYVAALQAFRGAHPALSANTFLTGRSHEGMRDVNWLHPEQRDMTDADWHAGPELAFGMHLHTEGDELAVWFNRWIHPVLVHMMPPRGGQTWQVGVASAEPVGFGAVPGQVLLPARSVVALVPA